MSEENLIRAKYGQARCPHCGSWHFAIQLNDDGSIKEFKCCRDICQRIFPFSDNMLIHIKGDDDEK